MKWKFKVDTWDTLSSDGQRSIWRSGGVGVFGVGPLIYKTQAERVSKSNK